MPELPQLDSADQVRMAEVRAQAAIEHQQHFAGPGAVKPQALLEHASEQEQFDPLLHREIGSLLIQGRQVNAEDMYRHYRDKTKQYTLPEQHEGDRSAEIAALHHATAEIITKAEPYYAALLTSRQNERLAGDKDGAPMLFDSTRLLADIARSPLADISFVIYVEVLNPEQQQTVAYGLLESGADALFASALKRFKNLDADTADILMERGYGVKVAANAGSFKVFSDDTKTKLLRQLPGQAIDQLIGMFESPDHSEAGVIEKSRKQQDAKAAISWLLADAKTTGVEPATALSWELYYDLIQKLPDALTNPVAPIKAGTPEAQSLVDIQGVIKLLWQEMGSEGGSGLFQLAPDELMSTTRSLIRYGGPSIGADVVSWLVDNRSDELFADAASGAGLRDLLREPGFTQAAGIKMSSLLVGESGKATIDKDPVAIECFKQLFDATLGNAGFSDEEQAILKLSWGSYHPKRSIKESGQRQRVVSDPVTKFKMFEGIMANIGKLMERNPEAPTRLLRTYGIRNFQRYSPEQLLAQLEREDAVAAGRIPKGPVNVVIGTNDDHNGANLDDGADFAALDPIFTEAGSLPEMTNHLLMVREKFGPIDKWVLAMHGSRQHILVGSVPDTNRKPVRSELTLAMIERSSFFDHVLGKDIFTPNASLLLGSCYGGGTGQVAEMLAARFDMLAFGNTVAGGLSVLKTDRPGVYKLKYKAVGENGRAVMVYDGKRGLVQQSTSPLRRFSPNQLVSKRARQHRAARNQFSVLETSSAVSSSS
jgi:hypothetical protein